jgi:hypothetical protein
MGLFRSKKRDRKTIEESIAGKIAIQFNEIALRADQSDESYDECIRACTFATTIIFRLIYSGKLGNLTNPKDREEIAKEYLRSYASAFLRSETSTSLHKVVDEEAISRSSE